MKVKVSESCPTLCDPVDYTVHGILQARILEWVAVPFSRAPSQPRDRTQVSCIAGGFFTSWATREAQIGKGVPHSCILSPCLFNSYAEYIMRNAGLEEAQAGIKIAGRNINNLRYADDTTLKAENKEELKSLLKVQFSEVVQSCPTLCDPINRSTPGLPVHHQLPEFTQTHVHWVGDAIQPSHPLSSPSPTFNLSQHQGLFQWVSSSHQVAKVLEFQLQHQSFQRIFRTDFL